MPAMPGRGGRPRSIAVRPRTSRTTRCAIARNRTVEPQPGQDGASRPSVARLACARDPQRLHRNAKDSSAASVAGSTSPISPAPTPSSDRGGRTRRHSREASDRGGGKTAIAARFYVRARLRRGDSVMTVARRAVRRAEFTRADGAARAGVSAARARRACRSSSSRCRRGRAGVARHAGRRRG